MSNLETHLPRIPFSVLKGTRNIYVYSVPVTLSNRWLHEVPLAFGINLVTLNKINKKAY